MSGRNRITDRAVLAARRAVARTEKRIREDGEAAVARAAWDEAVEQALASPDLQAVRVALSEGPIGERPDRDQQRETAHQRIVQFVRDCQQAQ